MKLLLLISFVLMEFIMGRKIPRRIKHGSTYEYRQASRYSSPHSTSKSISEMTSRHAGYHDEKSTKSISDVSSISQSKSSSSTHKSASASYASSEGSAAIEGGSRFGYHSDSKSYKSSSGDAGGAFGYHSQSESKSKSSIAEGIDSSRFGYHSSEKGANSTSKSISESSSKSASKADGSRFGYYGKYGAESGSSSSSTLISKSASEASSSAMMKTTSSASASASASYSASESSSKERYSRKNSSPIDIKKVAVEPAADIDKYAESISEYFVKKDQFKDPFEYFEYLQGKKYQTNSTNSSTTNLSSKTEIEKSFSSTSINNITNISSSIYESKYDSKSEDNKSSKEDNSYSSSSHLISSSIGASSNIGSSSKHSSSILSSSTIKDTSSSSSAFASSATSHLASASSNLASSSISASYLDKDVSHHKSYASDISSKIESSNIEKVREEEYRTKENLRVIKLSSSESESERERKSSLYHRQCMFSCSEDHPPKTLEICPDYKKRKAIRLDIDVNNRKEREEKIMKSRTIRHYSSSDSETSETDASSAYYNTYISQYKRDRQLYGHQVSSDTRRRVIKVEVDETGDESNMEYAKHPIATTVTSVKYTDSSEIESDCSTQVIESTKKTKRTKNIKNVEHIEDVNIINKKNVKISKETKTVVEQEPTVVEEKVTKVIEKKKEIVAPKEEVKTTVIETEVQEETVVTSSEEEEEEEEEVVQEESSEHEEEEVEEEVEEIHEEVVQVIEKKEEKPKEVKQKEVKQEVKNVKKEVKNVVNKEVKQVVVQKEEVVVEQETKKEEAAAEEVKVVSNEQKNVVENQTIKQSVSVEKTMHKKPCPIHDGVHSHSHTHIQNVNQQQQNGKYEKYRHFHSRQNSSNASLQQMSQTQESNQAMFGRSRSVSSTPNMSLSRKDMISSSSSTTSTRKRGKISKQVLSGEQQERPPLRRRNSNPNLILGRSDVTDIYHSRTRSADISLNRSVSPPQMMRSRSFVSEGTRTQGSFQGDLRSKSSSTIVDYRGRTRPNMQPRERSKSTEITSSTLKARTQPILRSDQEQRRTMQRSRTTSVTNARDFETNANTISNSRTMHFKDASMKNNTNVISRQTHDLNRQPQQQQQLNMTPTTYAKQLFNSETWHQSKGNQMPRRTMSQQPQSQTQQQMHLRQQQQQQQMKQQGMQQGQSRQVIQNGHVKRSMSVQQQQQHQHQQQQQQQQKQQMQQQQQKQMQQQKQQQMQQHQQQTKQSQHYIQRTPGNYVNQPSPHSLQKLVQHTPHSMQRSTSHQQASMMKNQQHAMQNGHSQHQRMHSAQHQQRMQNGSHQSQQMSAQQMQQMQQMRGGAAHQQQKYQNQHSHSMQHGGQQQSSMKQHMQAHTSRQVRPTNMTPQQIQPQQQMQMRAKQQQMQQAAARSNHHGMQNSGVKQTRTVMQHGGGNQGMQTKQQYYENQHITAPMGKPMTQSESGDNSQYVNVVMNKKEQHMSQKSTNGGNMAASSSSHQITSENRDGDGVTIQQLKNWVKTQDGEHVSDNVRVITKGGVISLVMGDEKDIKSKPATIRRATSNVSSSPKSSNDPPQFKRSASVNHSSSKSEEIRKEYLANMQGRRSQLYSPQPHHARSLSSQFEPNTIGSGNVYTPRSLRSQRSSKFSVGSFGSNLSLRSQNSNLEYNNNQSQKSATPDPKETVFYSMTTRYFKPEDNGWVQTISRSGRADVPIEDDHRRNCIFWNELHDTDKEDVTIQKLMPPESYNARKTADHDASSETSSQVHYTEQMVC